MSLMARDNPPYFEDVSVGDEIGPMETVATDESVVDFCEVWGQETPNRFTDKSAASGAQLAGPIVPGIMSMALMAQLLTGWAGLRAMKDLDLVFRQSIPHNHPLKISATVTDTRQDKGENLVECDIMMTGVEGERYVDGKAVLALPSRPS